MVISQKQKTYKILIKNNTMKTNKPKADFFEIVENIAMYAGFLAIVSLILINLFNV